MATEPGRRLRRIATAVFVALLFSPVATARDSLPLSQYPMYATARGPDVSFVVARATTASGEPIALSSRTVAQTADPLVAESWLRSVVAGGAADRACTEIAGRIGDRSAQWVEIRTERHRTRDHVLGRPSLVSATTEATCRVAP